MHPPRAEIHPFLPQNEGLSTKTATPSLTTVAERQAS
jgi:hypothetical protein